MGTGAINTALQGLTAYQQAFRLGAEKISRPLTPKGDGKPPPLDMLRELVALAISRRGAEAEAAVVRREDALTGLLLDTYA